jgi:hypothetical protein
MPMQRRKKKVRESLMCSEKAEYAGALWLTEMDRNRHYLHTLSLAENEEEDASERHGGYCLS